MKHFPVYLVAVLMAFVLFSCTSTPSNPDSDPEPVPPPLPEGPLVLLEGIYATSEKTPHLVNKVFDEKASEYWTTMPGAGPDEGLMLYFAEPTFVKNLEIEQPKSPLVERFRQVVLYGNGQNLGTFRLDSTITIGQELNSLYIRIGEQGITSTNSRKIEEETTLELTSFPKTKSVGISNLYLYNAEGKRLYLLPPKTLKGRVRASSTLEPEASYHAAQLFDSRKDFVWVEGAEGHGENESILLQVTEPTRFDAIKIWNGYQRSNEHWTKNGRAAKIEIGDGANGVVYELKNAGLPQLIKLQEPLTVREIQVKFLEVYKGSRYEDMVISEMRLYDNQQIMVIQTTDRENFKQDLLEKAQNTVLENVLDRRVKNYISEVYNFEYYYNKSIILRSDYSFVVYEFNEIYEENESRQEIIAEGNWELLDLEPNRAKLKVFGKYINLSELHDFYQGQSNSEVLKIFKDELTVEGNTIKGDKFFDVFYTQ